MIIDNLVNYKKYNTLHPLFKNAFNYLISLNGNMLAEGKFEVMGTDLFAIHSLPNSSQSASKLEVHQAYIDIHYIFEGEELFGWKAISECSQPIGEFDIKKDYMFYNDTNYRTIKLTQNTVAIVYPEDAHAPGIKTTNLKKVVLKVKL